MKENPKTPAECQCRWKGTPYPSSCPLLWGLTHRKQYHDRVNPQNSWSAEGDPPENPSGKEHAERNWSMLWLL